MPAGAGAAAGDSLAADSATASGPALDAGTAEPQIVSLVAGAAAHDGNGAEPAPTYRIAPGPPRPPGYAAELARQYGLDAAQLARTLRERGVVSDA